MQPDDPLSAFERAQRLWLAGDPRPIVAGTRADLPPFLADLLDPVVPLPPGVAHDPWLPEVTAAQRSLLTVVTSAWFVVLVLLFVALGTGNAILAAALALPALGLAYAAYRAWLVPGHERVAERQLAAGTWREGRHLTSAACLLVRGDRVDLLPRHLVVEVRDREAIDASGRRSRRLEVVVLVGETRRTVELPEQARDDVASLTEWLDDSAWIEAFPAAWTWGIRPVASLDELVTLLTEHRWPLDTGLRLGTDWLVTEAPTARADRWVLLGTDDTGEVRRVGEVHVDAADLVDPTDLRARLRGALVDGVMLPPVGVDDVDLRPRLESLEQHGVTSLALRHAQVTSTPPSRT